MFAGIIFAAQLATPPASYAQAKALADANEASLSAGKHAQLLATQDRMLRAAVADCARPDPDVSAFTVVLSLHADGSVASSWLQGETALAKCVRTRLVATGVPGHWTTPFYTSFEVSFGGH